MNVYTTSELITDIQNGLIDLFQSWERARRCIPYVPNAWRVSNALANEIAFLSRDLEFLIAESAREHMGDYRNLAVTIEAQLQVLDRTRARTAAEADFQRMRNAYRR